MASGPSKFADLLPTLQVSTLSVVESLGFSVMTPVQSATLPLFLGNKDVCVEACTGSGKTLAYVIPIIERLLKCAEYQPHQVGAIVLAPTRELARQIHQVVSLFAASTTLKSILLVGGTDVLADISACVTRGCNIITATPGRILDILRRCEGSAAGTSPEVRRLEVLVLDEADTLLDMGFHDALTEILGRLPKQRRTGLFSATQTQEVRALARAGLRNPAVVAVQVRSGLAGKAGHAGGGSAGAAPSHIVQSTPLSLTNLYTICRDSDDKLCQAAAFLQERASAGNKCIVFVLTCASVDYYAKVFAQPGFREAADLPSSSEFPILPLHGKQDPKKRLGVYTKFLESSSGALLCTDVAARGIDMPDVDWILQYDPPQNPAFYVHRVGRTARAGRSGAALLLLLQSEASYVQLLGVRNVPVHERPRVGAPLNDEHGVPAITSSSSSSVKEPVSLGPVLQQAAVADRVVLEAGTRAFVSFIRGYKEHDCRYIFRLDSLDVPSLALSFGLIKLPKVEELRGRVIEYAGVPGVKTGAIAYADPAKEARRQVKLAAEAEEMAAERAARDARRETAQAHAAAAAIDPKAAKPKKKRKHASVSKSMAAEWDVLAKEEALEKRFRTGRMSKAEYRVALSELDREQGIDPADDEMVAEAGKGGEDREGGEGDEDEEGDEEQQGKRSKNKRRR